MPRRAALTGTPGTGKSSVARILAAGTRVEEVGDLAVRLGLGQRARGGVRKIDLTTLVSRLRRDSDLYRSEIVIGHLAHLLPIRDVVVLRCHPTELGRRLSRARRGSPRDRRGNQVAETVGVVTAEALERHRNVFEVDTTSRGPTEVAAVVAAWLRGSRRASWGTVDWLADPSVTEHLLEWAR